MEKLPKRFGTAAVARLSGLRSNSTVRAVAGSLVPMVLALGAQLASFILVARLIGSSNFGVYSSLTAMSAVLLEFVGLGAGDLLIRAIMTERGRPEAYLGNVVVCAAPMIAMSTALLYLYFSLVGTASISASVMSAFVAGELVFARSFATIEMMAIGEKDYRLANIIRLASVAPRLLLALAVTVVAPDISMRGLIMLCLAQALLGALLLWMWVGLAYMRPALPEITSAERWTGVLFAISQSARAVQGNVDRTVLTSFNMSELVGSYAAASRLVQLGLFPIALINRVLYPRFFEIGKNGISPVRRYAFKVMPLLFAAGIASALAALVGSIAIAAILGRSFAEIESYSAQLVWAIPLIAIQYPAADALTGSGRQGTRTAIATISTMLFALFIGLSGHLFGLSGLIHGFIGGHAMVAAILWTNLLFARDAREGEGT